MGYQATEDRNLMSEHHDLDSQIGGARSLETEQLQDPEEREIEKREGHGPFSRSHRHWEKSQFSGPDGFFGTHRSIGLYIPVTGTMNRILTPKDPHPSRTDRARNSLRSDSPAVCTAADLHLSGGPSGTVLELL